MQVLDEEWKQCESDALEEVQKFNNYIPALQDAIQKAYDFEEKAWNILGEL